MEFWSINFAWIGVHFYKELIEIKHSVSIRFKDKVCAKIIIKLIIHLLNNFVYFDR